VGQLCSNGGATNAKVEWRELPVVSHRRRMIGGSERSTRPPRCTLDDPWHVAQRPPRGMRSSSGLLEGFSPSPAVTKPQFRRSSRNSDAGSTLVTNR
jgi:hypothetical protein